MDGVTEGENVRNTGESLRSLYLQTYLGDNASSVPDHHNKASSAIK